MDYFVSLSIHLKNLVKSKLWAKVIFAMLLGIFCGYALSKAAGFIPDSASDVISGWLAFPGKLFIKLVQMIMIALIVSSIISGIGGSTGDQLKSIGFKSLIYFVFTTIVAVGIGATLSLIIKPGNYMGKLSLSNTANLETNIGNNASNFTDFILNIIPENPVASIVAGDMLSIVVFSILIGVAVINLPKSYASSIMNMMGALQNICMLVVNWSMRIVPYAVFGIMAGLVATTGKESLTGLGVYAITVLIGLFIVLLFYLLLIWLVARFNPFVFLSKIKDAVLLAFSTTSSAAVMPLSLQIAEEQLKVRKNVSQLIIPLGTTINMDGTALYQCVSYIFITQVYGIELALPSLLLAMFTIIAASIGTPAVPGAGIIVLAGVLQNAGIPAESIMTIVGMERVLGMFRSAVNVSGDLTACMVFNKILK